jgi:hypothetical protein
MRELEQAPAARIVHLDVAAKTKDLLHSFCVRSHGGSSADEHGLLYLNIERNQRPSY